MTDVGVEPASQRDVAALAEVHLGTVLVAYRDLFPAGAPSPTLAGLTRDWEAAFEDESFRAFVARDDTGIVGTVAVRADPAEPRRGELRRLHVLPARWRSGVGGALHDRALAALDAQGRSEARLWVLEHNRRARRFYERRGWELVVGELSSWEPLGVTEVRYRHALS